jgi:hypothetical protein
MDYAFINPVIERRYLCSILQFGAAFNVLENGNR